MTTDTARRRLESIAEVLKIFPEVEWDRTAGSRASRVVFGWVDRDDDLKDFVVLTFMGDGRVGMTTSSAKHSLEFHKRLFGDDRGHSNCKRVEDVFAGHELTNVIRLEEPMPEVAALDVADTKPETAFSRPALGLEGPDA
jgi:hypothetical protein